MKFLDLLKILLLLVIISLLAMVFWSSLVVEEQLIGLKNRIDKLDVHPATAPVSTKTNNEPMPLGLSDPSLPNLLQTDPFWEKTLPELLGEHFKRYPTLFQGTVGQPDSLSPFSNWGNIQDLLSNSAGSAAVTLFGKYETLAPDFAWKMEERDRADGKGKEFWIHLRNDIFWEPFSTSKLPNGVILAPHFLQRRKVTAEDFKFAFDLFMNPFNQEAKPLAIQGEYEDVESFEVLSPETFVVRWKSKPFKTDSGETIYKPRYAVRLLTGGLFPLPEWVWAYLPDGTRAVSEGEVRTSSSMISHMQLHFAKNYIISCGPWIFEEMTDEAIRFRRNPNYFRPLAALYDNLEVSIRASFDSIWNDFKVGKIRTYPLNPQQTSEFERFKKSPEYLKQKENGEAIETLSYLHAGYYYIGWNMARPLFTSNRVRQALTLAIDRPRIIDQVLYGKGIEITGPLLPNSPSTNPNLKPWPFDPGLARKILQEEGWSDLDQDGILEKEIEGVRVPFKFKLLYGGRGPVAKATAEAISTQLKKIGIRCEPIGLEPIDLRERMDVKDFDAIFAAWGGSSPPENLRQIWGSKGAKEIGSSNFIGFSNAEVDEIIEALDYESDKTARLKLYHRFADIIYDEQPYTFLFNMIEQLLYRETVGNVFVLKNRQDLIPGADVPYPEPGIFFDKRAFQQ